MTQTPEQIAARLALALALALALIAVSSSCAPKWVCVNGLLYYEDSGVLIRDDWARTCATIKENRNDAG